MALSLRLKLRALAGRSLSVFLSLSIQAVAYLPVEYSSRARNGDRYGKEAENVQRTWLCELFCFALLFFRSAPQNFPPSKKILSRNIAFWVLWCAHSARSRGVEILENRQNT